MNKNYNICKIVDSPSFYEDVESIIGKKIEIEGIDNIIKFLIDNGYIKQIKFTNYSNPNDNKYISTINEFLKDKNIDIVIDELLIYNNLDDMNECLDKIDKLLKEKGYSIILLTSTHTTYFAIRKIENIKKKKYNNNVFENYGFAEYSDSNKKVQVLYKNTKYLYNYQTNAIYEIPKSNIKFIICTSNNKYLNLLINQYIKVAVGEMFRTHYEGLWNEPKQFVCAFNEDNILKAETDENESFEISII